MTFLNDVCLVADRSLKSRVSGSTIPNTMIHRSLHLLLPPNPPYNGPYDLESFAGNRVAPLVSRLKFFWFTRYGVPGNREIKFRFSAEDYETVRQDIEDIEQAFQHGHDGCGAYDFVADLGGARFISPNQPPAHAADRALLVYQFLTAGSKLLLDCLVPDGGGWKHEVEKASGYNRITSLETFHHLYCNMTGVPTWAALLQYPHQGGVYRVVSDLESRVLMQADAQIVLCGLHRIEH